MQTRIIRGLYTDVLKIKYIFYDLLSVVAINNCYPFVFPKMCVENIIIAFLTLPKKSGFSVASVPSKFLGIKKRVYLPTILFQNLR